MALMQLIGWLAYPPFFPVPLLALNCLAAWVSSRGRASYVSLPVPPPRLHRPSVWLATAVLLVTAYLLAGFMLLAWEAGAALLSWIAVPATITLLNLSEMGEAYRASHEATPTAPPTA